MALYDFECSKCKNKEERDIPMKDYDKEKHNQICIKCGSKMIRIFEKWNGLVSLCDGMYGIDGNKGWVN